MTNKDKFKQVQDYIDANKKLDKKYFEIVCRLHSDIFKHKYYKPCTCNPKIIVQWVDQLRNHFSNEK